MATKILKTLFLFFAIVEGLPTATIFFDILLMLVWNSNGDDDEYIDALEELLSSNDEVITKTLTPGSIELLL